MSDYISEEQRANRMALRQMGELDDYEDDFGNNFEDHFTSKDEDFSVKSVSRKIAQAAFSSEDAGRDYLKEAGSSVWDSIKKLLSYPGVREGLIIGSVMLFKMGLWYSYRRAAREGLEIVDI